MFYREPKCTIFCKINCWWWKDGPSPMGCPYFTDLHMFSHILYAVSKITSRLLSICQVWGNLLTLLVDDFAWFSQRLGVQSTYYIEPPQYPHFTCSTILYHYSLSIATIWPVNELTQNIWLSRSRNLIMSFPEHSMSFPRLNKSFPQDMMSFARLNKSFPRLNMSFP